MDLEVSQIPTGLFKKLNPEEQDLREEGAGFRITLL